MPHKYESWESHSVFIDPPPAEGGLVNEAEAVPCLGEQGWVVWDDDFGAWSVEQVVVLAERTEVEGKFGESRVQKVGSGSHASET